MDEQARNQIAEAVAIALESGATAQEVKDEVAYCIETSDA